MLQRLTIALTKVTAGNLSDKLLNEIWKIVHSLHQAKKLLKSYIIIQLNHYKNKMDIIFLNSENSKTFHLHRLLIDIADKADLRISKKSVALSNVSIYFT